MADDATTKAFSVECKLEKVDTDLGLVFGWGIVCAENGEPYVDSQGHHIGEAAMMKAAMDFQVEAGAAVDDMHNQVQSGVNVFSFPLTEDVKKAYGITCDRTGWMVAVAPGPELLAKFVDGTYTGFSIGGFIESARDMAAA
jgi:hypothetical protein